jgi:hypothetical protein
LVLGIDLDIFREYLDFVLEDELDSTIPSNLSYKSSGMTLDVWGGWDDLYVIV